MFMMQSNINFFYAETDKRTKELILLRCWGDGDPRWPPEIIGVTKATEATDRVTCLEGDTSAR